MGERTSTTSNLPFSKDFLEDFPPASLHHSFISKIAQRGLTWTPKLKKLILNEIDEKNAKPKAIADYLQISRCRISNLQKEARNQKIFREYSHCPHKLDDIAVQHISINVLEANNKDRSMRKFSDLQPKLLELAKESDLGCGEGVFISKKNYESSR